VSNQTRHAATIEDVARRAGVSRAAVSKVIRDAYGVSDDMRAKVQVAVSELGYRPRVSARAMRGATYTLGAEIPTINNQFFSKVITGASRALLGTRYQLIIAPASPEQFGTDQAVQVLIDRQVDGLLTLSTSPERLEELAQHTPLVVLGRHDASDAYDTVAGDDIQGARLAVRHLYDLGHREIVHLTSRPEAEGNIPSAPHIVRATGYRAAMAELGLGETARVVHVEPNERASREAALQLLNAPDRPTAIFAGHDELALGVLQAVADFGLTTADVSVIGYDDTDIAAHPLVSMTSVNQFGDRMGEVVIHLLLSRIGGRTEAVHELIAPKLMARRSSAPCPGTATYSPQDVRRDAGTAGWSGQDSEMGGRKK
jgi:LacI family transcriptional regulator